MDAGEAECAWHASVHTRVAAEGQLPRCRVLLCDTEIPVLVNTHCGSIGVPAGVGEQQVLKAWQHLKAAKSRRFFLFPGATLSLVKTSNSDLSYSKFKNNNNNVEINYCTTPPTHKYTPVYNFFMRCAAI